MRNLLPFLLAFTIISCEKIDTTEDTSTATEVYTQEIGELDIVVSVVPETWGVDDSGQVKYRYGIAARSVIIKQHKDLKWDGGSLEGVGFSIGSDVNYVYDDGVYGVVATRTFSNDDLTGVFPSSGTLGASKQFYCFDGKVFFDETVAYTEID